MDERRPGEDSVRVHRPRWSGPRIPWLTVVPSGLALLACLLGPIGIGPLLPQAHAATFEPRTFSSDAAHKRYLELIAELRCLVCQNQNIADSNAELAQDLRREVYERIEAGQSNEEIVEFMVARYGDFVLYRPPFKASTVLLWLGPFVLVICSLAVLFVIVRRRTAPHRAIAASTAAGNDAPPAPMEQDLDPDTLQSVRDALRSERFRD